MNEAAASDTGARPVYEDEETLTRERACFAVLEEAWGCTLHKLPMIYGVDAMAERDGELIGWVEVKGRNHNHDQYPTLILSLIKLRAGLALAGMTGKPFTIVSDFLDGPCFYRVDSKEVRAFRVALGGRTNQTRDHGDVEPVIHIPSDRLRPIKAKATDEGGAS